MEVLVRGRHVLMSAALHSYCERRISFSIGRFRHRVARVVVVVTKARSGARSELACRMVATMPGRPDIVVEQTDRDAYAAVDLTTRTLAEAVARELERERSSRGGASSLGDALSRGDALSLGDPAADAGRAEPSPDGAA